MNDKNPYHSPRHSSRQPSPAHRSRSLPVRILAAVGAGGIIGCAVSGLSVMVIGSTVGHMDYEFSGLGAVLFGTAGAVPAAVAGVFLGVAAGPAVRPLRLLGSAVFGALCSGMLYSLIVVPRATVPAVVVFWVGVVPVISGLVTGGVGGLIGIGDRTIR